MICERRTKSLEIAERLKNELYGKRLEAGTSIGSSRELAQRYGISPVTADKVLKLLVDADVLYRIPQRGTFVKHNPPLQAVVGYAGSLPEPHNSDNLFRRIHPNLVLKAFHTQNLEFCNVSYHTLCDKSASEQQLSRFNGLFLSAGFIDEKTLPQLRAFQGKIMVCDANFVNEQLLCNQVISDFGIVLAKLETEFAAYEKVVLLRARHSNAEALEKTIRQSLPSIVFETEILEGNPQLASFKYFSSLRKSKKKTLFISCSDEFSPGMLDASGENTPDYLSIDNAEKYQSNPENAVFTSIDPDWERRYETGIGMLKKIIEENDDTRHILFIPPRLVIRKTFQLKQRKQ